MKLLFFSDLHASIKHGLHGIAFVDQVQKTLDWVAETAKQEAVDYVICLGDVFHVQQSVDTPSLHVVSRALPRIAEAARSGLIIIEGNHDVWLKDGDWSLLQFISGVTAPGRLVQLVRRPETIALGDAINMQALPYTKRGYEPDPQAHFLVGHLEVRDALYRPGGLTEENGVSSNFEQVGDTGVDTPIVYVGGHYHHPQILGRALIVGSCCYHNFNDSIIEIPRGAVLLDLPEPRTPDLQDFRWAENPHTQPIHTVRAQTHQQAEEQLKELKKLTHLPAEQWRVRVEIPTAEAEHIDRRRVPRGLDISVVPDDPPKVVSRTKITSKTSPVDALHEYMEQVPPPERLDSRIRKTGEELLKNAMKDGA